VDKKYEMIEHFCIDSNGLAVMIGNLVLIW